MINDEFSLNYIKCPQCENVLNLSFIDKTCPNPLCSFDFTGLSTLIEKDDYTLREESILAYKEKDEHKRLLIKTAIKFNMGRYIAHLVECTWGAHYNTLFKDFIRPHFDDVNALKIVLKSDVIRTDKEYIISKNGYKMFWALYKYLDQIYNHELNFFLRTEFRKYYIKLRREKAEKVRENRRRQELKKNPDLKRIKKLL